MPDTITDNIAHIKSLTKKQFETLYQISQQLNTAVYQDSLIEDALDLIINVINAERGLFVKYNEKPDQFTIITARDAKKNNISDISEFSTGILKEVITKKEVLLQHDVQSDPKLSQFESIQIQKIKSVIGVPIFREGIIWGVMLVDSKLNRKEFTEGNLIFLNFFSNLVSLTLDRIDQFERLQDENLRLLNKLQTFEGIPDMVGNSQPMRELAKLIHRVAKTDATVLILGESGTGKDLVAQALHKLSNRRDKPFLAQFCGSIPDNLLESELFGYKKGAFTGANSDKKGLLEVADGGTFFLDEIADISSALQAKLLRVLENKEINRLGDTKVKKIDVRIIAATNRNLKKSVAEGKFREDLFYRLNVFPIKLSPLKQRSEDIILLANHFIKKFGDRKKKLDVSAANKLENYSWPGNVRQLLNIIQRALILCDANKLTDEHIVLEEEELESSAGSLKEFENKLLKKRMEEFGANKKMVAKSLGVSVRWIQLKLKEWETENN